jgi:hypothetical protein
MHVEPVGKRKLKQGEAGASRHAKETTPET